MTAKTICLDSNKFSNLIEFYDEIENKMTKNLDWRIGRNLNAFNDILSGGFGVYEYDEPIEINWINSNKSKIDFGFDLTLQYLNETLQTCHPSNKDDVQKDIKLAKNRQGETLFDIIVKIIKEHDNIILKLD